MSAMRATDDGVWHEVTEEAYRAFVRDHPRRAVLHKAHIDEVHMWMVYDGEEFDADRHHKTLQQAEVYTRAAEKKLMVKRVLTGLFGEQIVPPLPKSGTKRRKISS